MTKLTKTIIFMTVSMLLVTSCKKMNASAMDKNQNSFDQLDERFQVGKNFGRRMGFESEGADSIEVADQIKYISEDCVENYIETAILPISFTNTNTVYNEKIATEKGITISKEDGDTQGITIEYKGTEIIRYVLSGNLEGTLKIKSKEADCIVELDGLTVNSGKDGPALLFTSEKRTFLVVKEGTENTLIDNRVLDEKQEILNDKKGSVYAKGPLIITGTTSTKSGGKLSVINKGYKHGIYSHDYVRIADVTLSVNCEGETSRDCIRTLNAVIIDNGNLNLITKGTITDDEGCGIKVEGEDYDENKNEVEYTAGAGFILINNGTVNIEASAKGITANWKSSETSIGKSDVKEIKNQSVLYKTGVLNSTAVKPEPYLIMNGGSLNVKTTLMAYERNDASCSPEGIEAKGDIIINKGNILVESSDDAINAGAGITINGGKITANSSRNDALDANGSSGITINGGEVYAYGISTPECAFDSDQNPLTFNGGTIIGFGSSNITQPSANSSQKVVVMGTSGFGGTNLEITQNGKSIITCDLSAANRSEVMIFSSEKLANGEFSVSVDGKSVITGNIEGTVTQVNYSGNGFGGGRGGMGGGRGGFENFGEMPQMPEGLEPPEGFEPPEGMSQMPDTNNRGMGQRGNGGRRGF